MNIAVYSICHNEEAMLPFFLNHYQQFASSIVVFDNMSTDRSVDILKAAGAKVRPYNSDDQIRDDIMIAVKNQFWKASRNRHDWVIVVDIDEIVYHPNLLSLLEYTDATVLQPTGYDMIADAWPSYNKPITDQVRRGVPNPLFDKCCIFKPDRITDICYHPGAHIANPMGQVKLKKDKDLKLLHYNLMTLEYHLDKCRKKAARMSQINKERGWGVEYLDDSAHRKQVWEETFARSTIVI